MRRADAVEIVMQALGDRPTIVCNGMIGREVFTARDREESFYMIGSMGLALSIAIGVAVTKPQTPVVCLDGDGNVLMGAGVLASAGALGLKNLHHIVLDNEAHGSTGGQKTISSHVRLERIAEASGYAHAERVEPADLATTLPRFLARPGPAMLLVKVDVGNVKGIGRVIHTPQEITARFSRAVQEA
ncbi:MAG: thiamine pyrophosphate-dependent enzyme [Planctomycetota bacterium]|nr:thiamine pyrophosphate-dependent enzyme [Planctomycetota bacterium]